MSVGLVKFSQKLSHGIASSGEIRVHVLYKRPEIPANKGLPAFALSVTCSKRKRAANTGSTPVSATKPI
jgi:hypothetical protein